MSHTTDRVQILEAQAKDLRDIMAVICRCDRQGTCPACRFSNGEITALQRDELLGLRRGAPDR